MSDRVLLLFPPATSARFFPYLSLPQLTGYLERRGIETLQSDLNIELTHYLTDPHTLKQFAKNNILSMPPHNRSTQFKEFWLFRKQQAIRGNGFSRMTQKWLMNEVSPLITFWVDLSIYSWVFTDTWSPFEVTKISTFEPSDCSAKTMTPSRYG